MFIYYLYKGKYSHKLLLPSIYNTYLCSINQEAIVYHAKQTNIFANYLMVTALPMVNE
ncbi:MAG: hypothetical protein ACI8WT_003646 [Clostridium sp.]|jgi:hypothetical protein